MNPLSWLSIAISVGSLCVGVFMLRQKVDEKHLKLYRQARDERMEAMKDRIAVLERDIDHLRHQHDMCEDDRKRVTEQNIQLLLRIAGGLEKGRGVGA